MSDKIVNNILENNFVEARQAFIAEVNEAVGVLIEEKKKAIFNEATSTDEAEEEDTDGDE